MDYLSQAAAGSRGLINYNPSQNRISIGVDSKNVLSTTQTGTNRGRASVRLESKKSYTHGLFVADLAHVPQQSCGIWPAFWTFSSDQYPRWGEIDMYENINENTQSMLLIFTLLGMDGSG